MLPRQKRLTTELFNRVIEKGRIFHSAFFTLRAIKVPDAKENRFAATASKKTFKTAVERNRVRRRIYAALTEIDQGGHFCCIVLAKAGMLKLSKKELLDDLTNLFVKSAIIK